MTAAFVNVVMALSDAYGQHYDECLAESWKPVCISGPLREESMTKHWKLFNLSIWFVHMSVCMCVCVCVYVCVCVFIGWNAS